MKMKKWIYIALAATLAVSAFAVSACANDETPPPSGEGLKPTDPYELPISDNGRTANASVHDPSVFYDEASETYYAFGTHYAVASSKDLIVWKQEVSDNQWQKLYDQTDPVSYSGKQWPKALKETLDIVQPELRGNDTIGSTWAPDVNYHDGKYYMYYSITAAFGSSKSAIGRVEADSVLGPYSNNQVLFYSDGQGGSNAIDPELFTDKEGGLWMVYGSTYGGIFIVELENSGADWGLPKEDPVAGKPFGKKIWGGGNNVEGPFVFYNDLTGYYYLMTSYGRLMSTYNMRIARSENPNGPYVDITGQDLATVSGNTGAGGNKVAGSYKFTDTNGQGYAALGHNSVVKDQYGQYQVICHMRRQDTSKWTSDAVDADTGVGAGHTLWVSQMFFNEDGWPVVSPEPYVGEAFGKITQEEAAGEYDIVIHSKGTTAKPVSGVAYTLSADGTVKQGTQDAGTWSMKDDFYITIKLTVDEEEVEYKGVIVPGWNAYPSTNKQTPVFAITAIAKLNDQGASLWGISKREA